MKRFFWVLFVMSLWGHLLMAQEKAVSGIVVSTEDGLPMIGVAVVDKQTMNGVTTNEKGEFSMTVSPRTKTLHLSYLGYKTKEVTISGRSMNPGNIPNHSKDDSIPSHSSIPNRRSCNANPTKADY